MSVLTSSKREQSHDPEALNRDNWPIAAGLLQFPAQKPDGRLVQTLGVPEWFATFSEVADAGFDHVEITDTWLRPGDLDEVELDELAAAAHATGLAVPAVALIRRSILEPGHGDENLAYSHRSIDAAARLGALVLSIGLHEPLTPRQRDALWFWTEEGAINPPGDSELWARAVARLRELGEHAQSVGILLSLEMYEDTFLGTADSAVRLVDDIGLGNVGLNPDTGNLLRLHRPIENWDELLHKVLPYTNYWHVKNYLRIEDRRANAYFATPTSLELGLINYRTAVKDAVRNGFSGVITCEHYGGDGLSVSATNREYLRTVLPAKPTARAEPRAAEVEVNS